MLHEVVGNGANVRDAVRVAWEENLAFGEVIGGVPVDEKLLCGREHAVICQTHGPGDS